MSTPPADNLPQPPAADHDVVAGDGALDEAEDAYFSANGDDGDQEPNSTELDLLQDNTNEDPQGKAPVEQGDNNEEGGDDAGKRKASGDMDDDDNADPDAAGDDDEDGDNNDNDNGEEEAEEGKPPAKKKSRREPKTDIRRIRYSNDFKVKVLDELEVAHVTIAEMSRRHNLPEATLRDWVKTKDKIIGAKVNRRGTAKSNSRDNLQKITDALRKFMDLNDRLGASGMSKLPITNAMIAKQGQEVKDLLLEKEAKKPFLTEMEKKALHKFTASQWWAKKWSSKHNLRSVGHKEAAAAAAALSNQLPELEEEYRRDHIFFVVDTLLFYKILPTRVYAKIHDKPGPKAKKECAPLLNDRVSLFLCANATGTHKVPLTMLGNVARPPSIWADRQKKFSYLYHEKAWADPPSLLKWWKQVFLPNVREWTDQKVLLILQKPSIVDLDDPTGQVRAEFLPPLLADNHNATRKRGKSVSTFFEPPWNMLNTLKKRYRYTLLREILNMFEERSKRRQVAEQAKFATPGLRQGHLPHLEDCMRLLDSVWTQMKPDTIRASDDDDDDGDDGYVMNGGEMVDAGGKKKKKRKPYKKRKKKTEDGEAMEEKPEDIVADIFSDDPETVELMRYLLAFFEKNRFVEEFDSEDEGDDTDSLDKAVTEVKSCFLDSSLQLRKNRASLREHVSKWIGLEESQEVRTMLQDEIVSGMKLRLIVGVDNTESEDDEETGEADRKKAEAAPINENVADEVAAQLLQCAVRLSKEHPCYHGLASQLIEASDSAFVSVRNGKLQTKLAEERAKAPKKRFKYRTKKVIEAENRKKAAEVAAKPGASMGEEGDGMPQDATIDTAIENPPALGEMNLGGNAEEAYHDDVAEPAAPVDDALDIVSI